MSKLDMALASRTADQSGRRNAPLRLHRSLQWHCATLLVVISWFVIRHSSFAEPLQIALVSEVVSIQPGTPFYVGLHLTHKEHYHTYWKFPGIVGVPTDMAWKLPPGWKADPIEWPAPERVMMFQIKAQGYHGEVILPMKLTPPKDLEPGTKLTLKGKATWMCCGTECNPGFADLSVTLPVDKLHAPVDARWQKLFARARADQPVPLAGFRATASRMDGKVVLRLSSPADASRGDLAKNPLVTASRPKPNFLKRLFSIDNSKKAGDASSTAPGIFFTDDGYINADKDQQFRLEGEDLVIEMVISTYFTEAPPGKLKGILWLRDGSVGKGAIIDVSFDK